MQESSSDFLFDLWHARHIVQQIENRSGVFVRIAGAKPASWGECQDMNASRMTTLARVTYFQKDSAWKATALKSRLQLDRRGKREKSVWYDQEYRMTFQINNRAFESEPQALSALWESRASYESQECNLRAKLFKNAAKNRVTETWRQAQTRVALSMQRPRPLLEDFQGREHSLWDLAYRHAKLKFSHAPPIEDSWHRSVKSKLDRLVLAENSAAKYHMKNTSEVLR
ncbi:MAG: hypothetical protein KF713_02855 [Turneriella sp.]|nr:hypothetical protein [Turneriella sp.]